MIPKPLKEIGFEDINLLRKIQRAEDRTIEYKLKAPESIESDKIKWLLKPVCSFANTDGGDLVFGIKETQGLPGEIVGLEVGDLNQLKLTLEQMIQSGIEPQLRGVGLQPVPLQSGRLVLVIRIPKSWTPPHRVKSNGKFYGRSSAGTFEFDIPQIRQAFLLSETTSERIRRFHDGRIAALLVQNAPAKLMEGVHMVLHLVPVSSFASLESRPVAAYRPLSNRLQPGQSEDYRTFLNFDGMLNVAGKGQDGLAAAYTQFFRSGIIESVRVYGPLPDGRRMIPSLSYERDLLKNLRTGIDFLKALDFQPPVLVFLTLVSAKGWQLGIDPKDQFERGTPVPFDRDVMSLPGIELESFELNVQEIMKPLFDILWNAADFPSSLNYNDQSQWIGR